MIFDILLLFLAEDQRTHANTVKAAFEENKKDDTLKSEEAIASQIDPTLPVSSCWVSVMTIC